MDLHGIAAKLKLGNTDFVEIRVSDISAAV